MPVSISAKATGVIAISVAIITTQVGASFAKELIWAMPSPLGAVWLRWGFSVVFLSIGCLRIGPLRGSGHSKEPAGDVRAAQPSAPRNPSAGETPTVSGRVVSAAHRRTQALYIVCLLGMNFCIYEAFARIPVGIAVTVEFLGPLAVAIAGTRARIDLLWVVLAGGGVALLSFHPAQLNWTGVGFALLAAACWAGHITFGAQAAAGIGPVALLAIAYAIGTAVISVPMFAGSNASALTGEVLRLGVIVALTTSVLTLPLELVALTRITPALFSIIESLAPAIAALFAWIVIGERLGATDWLAVALVSIAACGATLAHHENPDAGHARLESATWD